MYKGLKDIKNFHPGFDHLWLEFPKNRNSILLHGVFCRCSRIIDSNKWIGKFEDPLSNILPTRSGIMLFITRYMNINLIDTSNLFCARYIEILQSVKRIQHVSKPTEVTTPTSTTLIDRIMISGDSRTISHTNVLPQVHRLGCSGLQEGGRTALPPAASGKKTSTNKPAYIEKALPISMDITSLYANIPQKEGIETVNKAAYDCFYKTKILIPTPLLKNER